MSNFLVALENRLLSSGFSLGPKQKDCKDDGKSTIKQPQKSLIRVSDVDGDAFSNLPMLKLEIESNCSMLRLFRFACGDKSLISQWASASRYFVFPNPNQAVIVNRQITAAELQQFSRSSTAYLTASTISSDFATYDIIEQIFQHKLQWQAALTSSLDKLLNAENFDYFHVLPPAKGPTDKDMRQKSHPTILFYRENSSIKTKLKTVDDTTHHFMCIVVGASKGMISRLTTLGVKAFHIEPKLNTEANASDNDANDAVDENIVFSNRKSQINNSAFASVEAAAAGKCIVITGRRALKTLVNILLENLFSTSNRLSGTLELPIIVSKFEFQCSHSLSPVVSVDRLRERSSSSSTSSTT